MDFRGPKASIPTFKKIAAQTGRLAKRCVMLPKRVIAFVGFSLCALASNEALAGRPSSYQICDSLYVVSENILKYRNQGIEEGGAGLIYMAEGGYILFSEIDANANLRPDEREIISYAVSLAIISMIKTTYQWSSRIDDSYKVEVIASCMIDVQKLFDNTGR